jgi:hypothetical protein
MDSATKPPVLFVYFMPRPFRELVGMIPAESPRRRPAKIAIPDVATDGIHFRYQGGQARSLLSLLSYLGSGEYRDRYLGIKIPPTNIQDYHLREARKFADGLANR